jgi:homoserine O-acetyltransferase
MRRMQGAVLALLLLCSAFSASQPAQAQSNVQFAELGECKLESGQVIKDCKIHFATRGTMNAGKSNVVVFLPSANYDSAAMLQIDVQPTGLLDFNRFHVIAFDRIGGGLSSSPSNSKQQPGDQFPKITMRDQVNIYRQVLHDTLGLMKVRGVVGRDMGADELFDWMVMYPDDMERAVVLWGTPRPTGWDALLRSVLMDALATSDGSSKGDMKARRLLAGLMSLNQYSPAYHTKNTLPSNAGVQIAQYQADSANQFVLGDLRDVAYVLRTWNTHDTYKPFSPVISVAREKAAAQVKAKVMMVLSEDDHMSVPESAMQFGSQINARMIVLKDGTGRLGDLLVHLKTIAPEVNAFLGE